MDISKTGLDLIYEFEGKHTDIGDGKYKAYRCPAGKWTIYAGLTKGVYDGMVVTEAEGERMLTKEIAIYEDAIERFVKVPLTQCQFDALVCFVFNVGIGAFSNSTLLKELNKGNYNAVPAQLSRWVKATVKGKKITLVGLARRRKAEGDLWLSGDDGDHEKVDYESPGLPQVVEPIEGEIKDVVRKSGTFWSAIAAMVGSIGGYISDAFNFAGDVIVETQQKLTLTDTLYKLLSDNMKEVFIIIAVVGAIGVVWRRIRAEKERKIG